MSSCWTVGWVSIIHVSVDVCIYVFARKWHHDECALIISIPAMNLGSFYQTPVMTSIIQDVLKFNSTLFRRPLLYCFDPWKFPSRKDSAGIWWCSITLLRKHGRFRRVNLPELSCCTAVMSLSLSLFLPSALETAKCGFSASRWDWWACATQTSRRSTNVSVTLAPAANAPPQWATISQNTNRPDYQHPIKAFTQANGEGAMLFLTRGC